MSVVECCSHCQMCLFTLSEQVAVVQCCSHCQMCCSMLFTLSDVSVVHTLVCTVKCVFFSVQITRAQATTASVPTPVVASQMCGAVTERVTVRMGLTRERLLAVVSCCSLFTLSLEHSLVELAVFVTLIGELIVFVTDW